MMKRFIAIFSLLVSLPLFAACSRTETANVEAGGFISVIASDAEKSADWYKSVFSLTEKRRIEDEGYLIFLLEGETILAEILEFTPPAPENPGRTIGLFKSGFIISDFDTKIARWREEGVEFFGNGQVFYDEAMGYHSTILLDPDGVKVQVFGYSETEPKD